MPSRVPQPTDPKDEKQSVTKPTKPTNQKMQNTGKKRGWQRERGETKKGKSTPQKRHKRMRMGVRSKACHRKKNKWTSKGRSSPLWERVPRKAMAKQHRQVKVTWKRAKQVVKTPGLNGGPTFLNTGMALYIAWRSVGRPQGWDLPDEFWGTWQWRGQRLLQNERRNRKWNSFRSAMTTTRACYGGARSASSVWTQRSCGQTSAMPDGMWQERRNLNLILYCILGTVVECFHIALSLHSDDRVRRATVNEALGIDVTQFGPFSFPIVLRTSYTSFSPVYSLSLL